ncbi:MAG: bifunctional folylpolyglutamate synthase/dihydrofolate synthase, partial [Moorea sp. SIO3I7]|nr:bifunctional folylpolyglutamate synthase/dihydrofolate synthase [Moorena sp. SIO3I7]
AAIPKNCSDPPTLFEVTTAAAWLYFAQQQVDVAVIEVGLGGRLDATNVCDRVLVSIITSLSWEHWQRLGPTLADIAKEKAGILKPGCPAVIGPLPPEPRAVVESRVNQLGCPVVWVDSAVELPEGKMPSTRKDLRWVEYGGISYSLPLLGQVQLVNSAIAIATVQVLQQQGWEIPENAIALGMAKTTWLGRLQWTSWENHHLLIDGAHNQASAQVLRQYVDTLGKSVNWVMGILSTKDHAGIFNALLRPGDRLSLVPVPDHSSAELDYLATLAQQICPTLADCATYPELVTGLRAIFNKAEPDERITVLCGSLYLVGHFLRTQAFVGGNG